MPLIKDTSYLQMPYSSETPDESFHAFVTIKVLMERIAKHPQHPYRCRTVGVIVYVGQSFYLQELDSSAEVRVSVVYLKGQMPFIGIPFTAQLFGFAHWREGIGPVLSPLRVAATSPFLARRLLVTMERAVECHYAMNTDAAREKRKTNFQMSTSEEAVKLLPL